MGQFTWATLHAGGQQVQLRTGGERPAPGAVYLCPSVGEYPIYDDDIYEVMRKDERRNALFRRAIEALTPGATVLEIGCGPDLLWTLAAADAGASRVYAIEVIEAVARRAEQTARSHPSAGIRVIAGDATRVVLPERADVCIAEIVGCIGGSEGIVAVLADARRRHLAPSASVIPSAVRTRAGAIGLLDLCGGEVAMPAAFTPYVEAVLRAAGRPFDLRLYVGGAGPAALLSTAGVIEDLRLNEQSYRRGGGLRLEITRPGHLDGLLAWIELTVAAGDAVLDSLAEDTNWLPVYVPFALGEPIGVDVGDVLSLQVTVADAADGIHPEYFFRGQLTRGQLTRGQLTRGQLTPAGSGAEVTVSAESRYSGGPFRSTVIHRRLLRLASMPTPDLTFQLLDRSQATAHADELQALHAEVYADPPYGRDPDAARFTDRFRVQRRQPGFVLAEARHGGYLVGYASGMPLRPSTSWWRHLTTPLPEELTTEHPGRTFALTELLVRASWRRQGIGQTLHHLILANRHEARATLTVLPAATPAQNAFAKWGWRKVARVHDPDPGSPVSDVLVTTLPVSP